MIVDFISIPPRGLGLVAVLTLLALGGSASARAETLSGPALANALQRGGYVIVMRHASSPQTPPTAADAEPGNGQRERQLDATGRAAAHAMGVAIKALRLRIGAVWSSPTYRALETVRLAGLPKPRTAPELGDRGHSMAAAGEDQASWLKAKAAAPPKRGTDTVVVTQYPNMVAAFGPAASGLIDGEALVFHPTGHGAADLIGRIRIEQWPSLAKS